MTNTPETDKAERMAFSQEYMVPTEFARRMERERDEAIEARKASAADWLNQIENANARVSAAKRERDEAMDKYAAEATDHMLAVNKLCNERDEALAEVAILRQESQREAEHHDRMVNELEGLYDQNANFERERDKYKNAILECLEKNCHLADGEDCTLIGLKKALL